MKIKKIIAIAAIFGVFVGCQKAQKGEAGTPGIDGKNGNANVTSITLNATSWSWDATNYWRSATWSGISQLTANVVNNGAVMLYQNDGSGNFIALPLTGNITATVQEHDFFKYGVNTIQVVIENSDLSDPNPPTSLSYKLVCIPQAIIKSNPNIDIRNYNEVKQVLNLQD